MKEIKTVVVSLANNNNFILMQLWYIPTKICVKSISYYSGGGPIVTPMVVKWDIFNFAIYTYDNNSNLQYVNLKYDNTSNTNFNMQHRVDVYNIDGTLNNAGYLIIHFEFTKPELIIPQNMYGQVSTFMRDNR